MFLFEIIEQYKSGNIQLHELKNFIDLEKHANCFMLNSYFQQFDMVAWKFINCQEHKNTSKECLKDYIEQPNIFLLNALCKTAATLIFTDTQHFNNIEKEEHMKVLFNIWNDTFYLVVDFKTFFIKILDELIIFSINKNNNYNLVEYQMLKRIVQDS